VVTEDSTPYADAWRDYHRAGWLSVLPLPYRAKWPPPIGFTGYDGIDASYADMLTWAEDPASNRGHGNVCLRLPDGVVGIDEDNYKGKAGSDTIAEGERRYGPLPPAPYSTSRDDGSRIRFFRVPPGTRLCTEIRFTDLGLGGVEIVQRHHRYAVCWPSLHPEGRTYHWHDSDGQVLDEPPAPDKLPDLPKAWVDAHRDDTATYASVELGGECAAVVRSALTDGEPSPRVAERHSEAVCALRGPTGSRYDNTLKSVGALLRYGKQGAPGVGPALAALRDAYTAAVADDRGGAEVARAEFNRMIRGAGPMLSTPDDDRDDEETIRALVDPRLRDKVRTAAMTQENTSDEPPLYGNVAALLDGTMPPPPAPNILRRQDDHHLFYQGELNYLYGDPEDGKTWVALAAGAQVLAGGGKVLFVDLDHNGIASIVNRLMLLGAPRKALADPNKFRYCEPEDSEHLARIVLDCKPWRPDVVVVDCVGELMALRGANSDNADDYTATINDTVLPLVRAGAAAILIDHLAKSKDSRAYGAGGTMAKRRKLGGTSIRVNPVRKLVPGKGGAIALIVVKDRHGGVKRRCEPQGRAHDAGTFVLTEYDGNVSWHITASSTEAAADIDKAGESGPSKATLRTFLPAARELIADGETFAAAELAAKVFGRPTTDTQRQQARRAADELVQHGVLRVATRGSGKRSDPRRWGAAIDDGDELENG
jgi:hypothetical protein